MAGHYITVIRPDAVYAVECLALTQRGEIEKVEDIEIDIKERTLLRKDTFEKDTFEKGPMSRSKF